jgi:hypothetical protein
MEFEDFTWNFMGIMQTKIAMPTKRGGQDPSKRSRDRRMVRWCLACPTIHEYRRLPLFAPLAQAFSLGQSISLLLSPCSLLTCKAYGVQSLQVPSSIHRTPSHTHTHHSILQIPFLGRLERDMHENVGGLEHDFHFFHILGISSSQLTFIFFRGVAPTSYILHISRMNWWKSTGSDALFHQALQSSLAQLCRPGSATAMHCDAVFLKSLT